MKRGQIVQGIVERVDFPAKGIVRVDSDNTVAVKNVLPGQKVTCRVKKVRHGDGQGMLISVDEKAENEKKYQMYDKNGVRINLFFDHGKYSKTPSADVKKKGESVSSRTDYAIIADLRYGHMCLFAYKGKQGKRKLVKAAPCSSAANIPGTKTTRTPAGQHRISWKTDRLVYTNSEGKKWQYWSCSMTSGGWGIHSLTYHMSARYRYDRVYLLGGKLGAHNSPACIRTENSMADWVYKHCRTGTTLYVIR